MKKFLPSLPRLALLFVSAVLFAQTEHITAFTGTWKLNVAKSKFSPGPGLKSETVTIASDGKTTVEAVGALGKSLKWSYPWSDGAEVPIEGIANATTRTKIRGHTMDQTTKAGKGTTTSHVVLSPGGRIATVTIDGTDWQGRPEHDVEIFEKQ